MSRSKIRAIAFYLPQFYPTPENDEWWEPGFTEWTNVARAKPLFKGHYQPRIPRDLGFYDLRVPETREKQVRLAREAGIEGFCYWHYWMGNGRRLLSEVFEDVVATGTPDFPFCLCWANHSWYAKTWDPDRPNKLLMEQTYPGVDDYIAHFKTMLPAFQDRRYMRMEDGRLIFGIFDAFAMTDFITFKDTWNRLAEENGLPGFYFFGLAQGQKRLRLTENKGYDAVVYDCLFDTTERWMDNWLKKKIIRRLFRHFRYIYRCRYEEYMADSLVLLVKEHETIPCIDPDFDHSPRNRFRPKVLYGSTPQKWGALVRGVRGIIERRSDNNRLMFIKAWNEWAEGNYLEPDRRWGKAYIEETYKAINDL